MIVPISDGVAVSCVGIVPTQGHGLTRLCDRRINRQPRHLQIRVDGQTGRKGTRCRVIGFSRIVQVVLILSIIAVSRHCHLKRADSQCPVREVDAVGARLGRTRGDVVAIVRIAVPNRHPGRRIDHDNVIVERSLGASVPCVGIVPAQRHGLTRLCDRRIYGQSRHLQIWVSGQTGREGTRRRVVGFSRVVGVVLKLSIIAVSRHRHLQRADSQCPLRQIEAVGARLGCTRGDVVAIVRIAVPNRLSGRRIDYDNVIVSTTVGNPYPCIDFVPAQCDGLTRLCDGRIYRQPRHLQIRVGGQSGCEGTCR